MAVCYVLFMGLLFRADVYFFQNGITYHEIFLRVAPYNESLLLVIVFFSFVSWIGLALKPKLTLAFVIPITVVSVGLSFAGNLGLIYIVSMLAVPGVVILLLMSKTGKIHGIMADSERDPLIRLILNYLCLTAILLSALSLATSLSDSSLKTDILYQLSLLFSYFSPLLVLAISVSLPIKLILEYLSGGLVNEKVGNVFQGSLSKIPIRIRALILFLFIILSAMIIIIPQTLSDREEIIGVDTKTYLEWNKQLNETGTVQDYIDSLFIKISDGDRPLTLLIIHQISNAFYSLDPEDSIEIGLATIIGMLLVLVTYFLCKEIFGDDLIAIFGSFLSSVGYQMLVGLYAGFYANWLSLIPSYLALIFLLKYLKTSINLYLVVFGITLVSLLFVHVYTWTLITLFVAIFLLYSLVKRYYKRRAIILALIIVASCIALDIVRSEAVGTGAGIEKDFEVAGYGEAGLPQFNVRWDNLVRTVQVHVGGFYSNFVVLALILLGVMTLKIGIPTTAFVVIFVSLLIIPVFFGDVIIISRVLYEIPFQIPAAIGLTIIFRKKDGKLRAVAVSTLIVALAVVLSSNLS